MAGHRVGTICSRWTEEEDEILIVIKNDLAVLKIQLDELIKIQNQTLDLFKTINEKKSGAR